MRATRCGGTEEKITTLNGLFAILSMVTACPDIPPRLPTAALARQEEAVSIPGTPLQTPVQDTGGQSWEGIEANQRHGNAEIPKVGVRQTEALRRPSELVFGNVTISVA
jgi:hypothetical protein